MSQQNHPGRYFSDRDRLFISSINAEFMGDIVEQTVNIFKISPEYSKTNIYGESVQKFYYPGVNTVCLVDTEPQSTEYDVFGPNTRLGTIFAWNIESLKQKNIIPEVGDIVEWFNSYFEISNVVDNRFLNGQFQKRFSFVCNAHLSKLSSLNLINLPQS